MKKFYSKEELYNVDDTYDNGKYIKLTTTQIISFEDETDIKKTYTYYIPKNKLIEIINDNQMYEFSQGKRKLCPSHIKNFDEDFLSKRIMKIIDKDYFEPVELLKFIIARFDIFVQNQIRRNRKLYDTDWQQWALYCSKEFYKMYNINSIDIDDLEKCLLELGQAGIKRYNQRLGGEFIGCFYDNYYDKKRPLTSRKYTVSHDDYVFILCLLYAYILFGDVQNGIEFARCMLPHYIDV